MAVDASRVVPATLVTMTRSSPRIRLTSEDLPTFGLPMMATLSRVLLLLLLGGKCAKQASSRSPVPWPWTAETAMGSPRPRL